MCLLHRSLVSASVLIFPFPAAAQLSTRSGIVSACFRLAFSIKLTHSSDKTYWLSRIGFITLPEVTSGFLVMSLPMLPRFAGAIWTSQIAISLRYQFRSWRGLTTSKESGQSNSNSSSEWQRMAIGMDGRKGSDPAMAKLTPISSKESHRPDWDSPALDFQTQPDYLKVPDAIASRQIYA